jgi:hypothetical protein
VSDQDRLDRLFQEAQRLPAEKRLEWLRSACAGDESLVQEVSARLADADAPPTLAGAGKLAAGMRISHYRLGERLGAGGMGEVWLATDETLGRKVALKFPTLIPTGDQSSRHRLLREARSAAALDHPSVCRVFELGQAEGRDFIAMELIPGQTLASLLVRGPLPVAQALEWGAALAAALDEAHRKAIVHRDLKPGNVMVTPTRQVKVTDFGLARPLHGSREVPDQAETWTMGLTTPGVIVGTPAYMAPELLDGAEAAEKSDIWALGCILYEMLTGVRPFRGTTATAMIAAILAQEPDLSRLPRETPAEVRVLIGRTLRKDPARRVRDAGDIRLALDDAREALRDGLPVADVAPPTTVDAGKPVPASSGPGFSRRHLLLGAGAAGLLGTGAGFGAATLRAPGGQTGDLHLYQRLTFRRGLIRSARFAPDQQTILYGALWDGDECRTFTVRPDSPESRPLELPPSTPVSISAGGELALLLGDHLRGLWPLGTLARVPLAGGAPRQMLENVSFADWSRDGKELAVVRLGAEKARLEFPIGKVIFESKLSTLTFPRVSPAGDTVAFFDHTSNFGGCVVVVDRAGATKYRSPEFLELYGLAWRGDEVWFTGADERRTFRAIHAVNPPGDVRVVMRMPGNATLHDISTDGRLLIAHTADRGESAVLAHGETVERNLSWLDATYMVDLSRDGRLALLTELGQGGGRDNSVYVRGTDGAPAVRLGDGHAMAMSPDGQWVVAAPIIPAPHLDLVPTGAGDPRRLEVPGMTFRQVRWLPDGERIVASAGPEGRSPALVVLALSGGTPRQITPADAPLGPWAISPDGSDVIVTPARADARIYPVAGGEPRPVAGLTAGDRVAAWIEQGLLVTSREARDTVFLVDPVSGQRSRWRRILPADAAGIMDTGSLVVTPDGRSYAYWWHRALSDLYLVRGAEAIGPQ